MLENTVAVAGGVGRIDADAAPPAVVEEAGSPEFEEPEPGVAACVAVDEVFCAAAPVV